MVKSSPCTTFIDSNLRDHYRRMYERGVLSKETYVEVCGDSQISYTTEVKGRMGEIERGEPGKVKLVNSSGKPYSLRETGWDHFNRS